MYLSSCLFNFVSSGLLVTPRCSCLCQPSLVLPRLVCLRSILIFESTPRLSVPVSSSCVHCDRRPDLTISGAHSPRLFSVLKVFCVVPVCLSRGMEVVARHLVLAHCKLMWGLCGIATSPLAASPSSLPFMRKLPPFAGKFMTPSVAHPSLPFAGDGRRRPRLSQTCR